MQASVMPTLTKRSFPFEVKQVDEQTGTFEGYASIFGNVDDQGDVIEKGAFTKTLQEAGHRVKICWQHDARMPIGKPIELREDENGLYVKAKITPTTAGKDALALLRDGVVDELSIGYDVVKDSWRSGVRHLKELRLWEVSLVTWASNRLARITKVKRATAFADLPLAPVDREWNADEAEARVRIWAGGPDKENIDWTKYQKAFLWYDSDAPENFGSYKLPFADVINGVLYAAPRGIFAAAAVLQGARGGVHIPEEDIPRVRRHIERYYEKMGRVAPWLREVAGMKTAAFQIALQTEGLRLTYHKLLHALKEALEGVLTDRNVLPDEKPAIAAAVIDEFKQAMVTWFINAVQAGLLRSQAEVEAILAEAQPVSEGKRGRILSAASVEKIRAALVALDAACEELNALLQAAEQHRQPDDSTDEFGSTEVAASNRVRLDPGNQSNPSSVDENVRAAKALLESLRAMKQTIRGGVHSATSAND